MRWRLLLILLALSSANGCATHRALAQKTVHVTGTIADINYQQVLDNVAHFTENPFAIPSIAVVNAGTVTVGDTSQANGNAAYSPTMVFSQQGGGLAILTMLLGFEQHRETNENWSLNPITDTDNLRRIRCAFQMLVADASINRCMDCEDELKDFFLGETQDLDCIVPRGWYNVGRKRDVPRNACYVGSHCGVYVWVMPDGLEGLSQFTLAVMDLATGEPHAPEREVTKFYKADGTLERYEIKKKELDREGLKDADFLPDRDRNTGHGGINRGLFFIPR
jgi:hypothetical protein